MKKNPVQGQLGIQGYYGHGNIGDEALLASLVQELRRTYDAGRLVVFTESPEATTASLGIRAVYHHLPTGVGTWLRGYLGRNRSVFRETLATFRNLEWLILGGGGVLKDLPTTSRFLLTILQRIEWSRRLGHQVAILGVGAGPFHHPESIRALRRVLPDVQVIAVRDEYSKAQLVTVGLSEDSIHVTADLAFLLDPHPMSLAEESRLANGELKGHKPWVAISARAVDLRMPQINKSFLALVRYLRRDLDATVWLVPFQVGGGVDDLAGARAFREQLGHDERISILGPLSEPRETLALLSRMDIVIGEKLHSLILSLVRGTPVMGISYHPKVANLFVEMGRPRWCVALSDLTPELLVDRFVELWNARLAIREEIPLLVQSMRARAHRNIQLLHEHLQPQGSRHR